jgi:hypothetical protein
MTTKDLTYLHKVSLFLALALLRFSSSTLYAQPQAGDYEPLSIQPLSNTAFWSNIDLLISNNTNYELEACSEMVSKSEGSGKLFYHAQRDYCICVKGVKVRLFYSDETYGENNYTHAIYDSSPSRIQNLSFHIGQENEINQIFDKFLEWEAIAKTNNSLPFEKEIPIYYKELIDTDDPYLHTNTFILNGSTCELKMNGGETYVNYKGIYDFYFYDSNDVIEMKNQLNQLPKIKLDLANKIRQKMSEIKPDNRTPANLNLYK